MDKPYQVIARKYRPQTFSNVVGQEAIVTTLKNALRFKRLAHAYLFCGCRGTGKTTLARVFAKALNCSQLTDDFEPCNACPSCLDIIAGRSLDVLEIDGASNRGIDDIRQINETIGYAPSSGKYKIYIIDEVHMLTKEAFNALLKTLEEPPANVKFFFATTEPHKVLPTIISRCQRFDLNRIPFAALKQKLAWIATDLHVECEDAVFSLVADLSEGSLRDAESLLDQIICYAEHPITAAKVSETLGLMPHTSFFALDKAFEEQNLTFAFELASEIFTSGKDLSYFLDNLIEHYRSLLKLKLGVPTQFATSKLHDQILASTSLYTDEQCLYILDFLIQWQQQISKTPFKRVSLEMILLHIIRSKHRITLPSLVKRLTESNKNHELRKESPATIAEEQIASAKPSAPSPEKVEDKVIASQNSPKQEAAVNLESAKPIASFPEKAAEEDRSAKFITKLDSPKLMECGIAESKSTPVEEDRSAKFVTKLNSLKPTECNVTESLVNKIKEKINAGPAIIEEQPQPAPQVSLLLSKSQWEAAASAQENKPPQNENSEIKPTPSSPPENPSRYDTLIRFAAVELEGVVKKESN